MKLRDLLIKKVDKALAQIAQHYQGGLLVHIGTASTRLGDREHVVTIIVQVEEVCPSNIERHEKAELN